MTGGKTGKILIAFIMYVLDNALKSTRIALPRIAFKGAPRGTFEVLRTSLFPIF